MIETYSDKYFLDVVRLVENFHKEAVGEYDSGLDANTLIETIKSSDRKNAFLLTLNGVCEGILFGARFNSMVTGKPVFQEIIWYVNEGYRSHGVRLLKFAQNMLKSEGVSIMIMAVLENSKTEKLKSFYERLGFKKMETHYIRDL